MIVFWEMVTLGCALGVMGCLAGWIAFLAAHRWREGMGIGLWEPLVLLFSGKAGNIGDDRASLPVGLMLAGVGIFLAIGFVFPPPQSYWLLGFATLALIAAAVDKKQNIIPDPIVFLLLALGLARCFSFTEGFSVDLAMLQSAVLGFLAAYALCVVLQSGFDFFGRDAFFWGDLKYCLALGVWLGFPAILTALLLASLTGLLFASLTRQKSFPFAPFLSGAALLVLFL